MLEWQDITVFLLVTGALGFVLWRGWRAIRSSNRSCGGCQGCGSAKPEAPALHQQFVPLQIAPGVRTPSHRSPDTTKPS